MKKLKFFLFLLLSACFCFAESQVKELLSPGLGQVVTVGKITVHVLDEENFEFYAKTWGVKDYTQPDSYVTFDYSYNELYISYGPFTSKSTNSAYHVYSPEDYFLTKEKVKNGEFETKNALKWCFYSDENFQVYLPFKFKAKVPKGAKYVYLGNFDYYVSGPDFLPEKIVVSDNYKEACQYLKDTYGKDVDLYRVELRNAREPEKRGPIENLQS